MSDHLTIDLDKFRVELERSYLVPERVIAMAEAARVTPEPVEPEVIEGDGKTRLLAGSYYCVEVCGCKPFMLGIGDDRSVAAIGTRYIRLTLPTFPPRPKPVMPEGPPPKRIIARRGGKAYHGVAGDGVTVFVGSYPNYANAGAAQMDGWEIEIVEESR